ncbi:hypothetical protein GGS24DRAFT_119839 [Hypoxylon argillaceum]|nr:hypothetical protein GGS24DRAFT_119839 [Hypoxylon argillaceum]
MVTWLLGKVLFGRCLALRRLKYLVLPHYFLLNLSQDFGNLFLRQDILRDQFRFVSIIIIHFNTWGVFKAIGEGLFLTSQALLRRLLFASYRAKDIFALLGFSRFLVPSFFPTLLSGIGLCDLISNRS